MSLHPQIIAQLNDCMAGQSDFDIANEEQRKTSPCDHSIQFRRDLGTRRRGVGTDTKHSQLKSPTTARVWNRRLSGDATDRNPSDQRGFGA